MIRGSEERWRARIEALINAAARAIATVEVGSSAHDRYSGLYAGLVGSKRGRRLLVGQVPSGTEMHVASLLAGSLQGWLIRSREHVSDQLLLAATAYAASVAGHLASRGPLADDQRALVAHTAACVRVTRQGRGVEERDERVFFAWLLAQTGLPLTEELLERYEKLRERRLERLRKSG